jgi:heterodisulfide reductase subunit A2
VFIRAIPAIHVNRTTNNPVVVFEDPAGGITTREVDLVVLACGLQVSEGTEEIRELLGLPRDYYGFVKEAHAVDRSCETSSPGIFVAGVCQGPKDIPDSATQGSAAAAKAGIFLKKGV